MPGCNLCYKFNNAGRHSAFGNVSDCRAMGRKFDPGRFHTFLEIDHEIISRVILLPSAISIRVVVSCKRNYVHEVLVNCPGKKEWLDELTVLT